MSNTKDNSEHKPKETTRLEIFSDGVFAIAITLLVLDLIQVLHTEKGEHSLRNLFDHGQSLIAFLLGFITILVCWINHDHVFDHIKRKDDKLPWVNGFVLLMISFTPFPTAILAEYLGTEGNYAMAIYGLNYVMIAIGSWWLCSHAFNKRLIDEEDREFFHCVKLSYGYAIPYTLLAFLVCFLYIPAAIVLYLLLFAAFAFPKKLAMRILKGKQKKARKPSPPADERIKNEE